MYKFVSPKFVDLLRKEGYVYLEQHYSLNEKNKDKEIQRRIMAGWAAYARH